MFLNITIVVSSLNPDDKLLKVIDGLIQKGFDDIIVVNDGSDKENEHYFEEIKKYSQCTILKHSKNLGKGRALKTAFNHFLDKSKESLGVITVDGDGQHDTNDIVKCAKALEKYKDKLILGVRNFNSKNIPARSKLGNNITTFAFKFLCGVSITDTQTGLRGIPKDFVREIVDLSGERFDYETNMLLETKRKNIKIQEVPIKTIYLDENSSSHFNPLTDSLSIYKVIGTFIWSSIVAMLCDFSLFAILKWIFQSMPLRRSIFIATVGARIISSLINFLINKNVVFVSKRKTKVLICKYYLLCIIQMLLSYMFVYLLAYYWNFNAVIAKLIVDFILFLISFKVQLNWVFKNED